MESMSETTVRKRPVTVSNAHFKQTVADELRRRAERDREAASRYDYSSPAHVEALRALAAYVEALPPNHPILGALREVQAAGAIQTDTWQPGYEQNVFLSILGTDPLSPPVEVVAAELVLGGIEDLTERNSNRFAEFHQQTLTAKAQAGQLEPALERARTAEADLSVARARVKELEGELVLARADAQHFPRYRIAEAAGGGRRCRVTSRQMRGSPLGLVQGSRRRSGRGRDASERLPAGLRHGRRADVPDAGDVRAVAGVFAPRRAVGARRSRRLLSLRDTARATQAGEGGVK
jgi:hypothetical protein